MEALPWKLTELVATQCGVLNGVGWLFAASVVALSFRQALRHKTDQKAWIAMVDDLGAAQSEIRNMMLVLLARVK